MKWFEPKVLKRDYDRVLAESLEKDILIEEKDIQLKELKRKLSKLEYSFIGTESFKKIKSNKTVENKKSKQNKGNWKFEFSPEFFVEFVLSQIYENPDEILRHGNYFYQFNNKDLQSELAIIAELTNENKLRITPNFMLSRLKILIKNKSIERMPRGSMVTLFDKKLIDGDTHTKGLKNYKFIFHIKDDEGKYLCSSYQLTEYAMSLYKKE